MKPRFSILALMGVTAYVAVVVAAINTPTNQVVNAMAFYCWLAATIALAVLGAQSTSAVTVFARGCLFTSLIYFVVGWSGIDFLLPGPEMPNQYLSEWLSDRAKGMTPPAGSSKHQHEFYASEYIWRHMLHNCSLAFGLVGGCLALWRYRVLERRAKEPAQ